MIQLQTPKLFWLFAIMFIVYLPTFSMDSTNYSLMVDRSYELHELREEFETILKMQPKFIQLDSTESQYKDANGIYQLLPYYQKISPDQQKLTSADSRFIIHKHVISGQWQLTEFYAYPLSKNIKAFPVTEENEKNALLNNRFIESQHIIQEMKKEIMNMQTEIKSKNETIESLKNQNGLFASFSNKIRDETKQLDITKKETEKQMKKKDETQTILESRLIEKEKKIRDIYKTQNELELILIEKEVQICNFFERQNQLESKLIEYKNEICDISKIRNQLELQLLEKENQISNFHTNQNKIELKVFEQKNKIHDLEKNNLEIIKKSKDDLNSLENENLIKKQKLFKYEQLNAKLECENKNFKSRENLLNKEIEDLYVTNISLENNLKETKNSLQKYELQQKEIIFENNQAQTKIKREQLLHTEEEQYINMENNILLNLVYINTEQIKEEEKEIFYTKIEFEKKFGAKIEFEEFKTPKLETPLTSKQKRKKKKGSSKTNFQSYSDDKIENKLESIQAKESKSTLILENKTQTANVETTNVEQMPKKQSKGFLKLIAAQVKKQDKEKENLEQFKSESQIEKQKEFFTSKDQKNLSISNPNTYTSVYEEPTKFQDSFTKIKQMQKNIQNLDKNQSQFKEKQEFFISQNHIKKKGKNINVTDLFIKKDEHTQSIKFLLDRIAQILHESRPLNLNFSKQHVGAIHYVIKTKQEEHIVFVKGVCKRLQDLNNESLISKIALFLENNQLNKDETEKFAKSAQQNFNDEELSKIRLFLHNQNALTTRENYQYEFLFVHHGASFSLQEKLSCYKSQQYFTPLANDYGHALEKVCKKYEKILHDALLVVEDKKTRIKFKCFQDKPGLYYESQYAYEMILMVIGLIYGSGDILNELVNQITELKR